MAALLMGDDGGVGHPVHLDRAPAALEGLVAVPGGVGATEREQGAAMGRDLGGNGVEVGGAPEDP